MSLDLPKNRKTVVVVASEAVTEAVETVDSGHWAAARGLAVAAEGSVVVEAVPAGAETATEEDSGAVVDSVEEASVVEGSVVEGSVAVVVSAAVGSAVGSEDPPFGMSPKMTYHHMSN